MISNESIILIGALGVSALTIFLLVILFYSKRGISSIDDEKDSWYCDEGQEFDEDILLSLYGIYHEYMGQSLNRHFNVRNYYTTLLSALSALYIGGTLQLVITGVNVPKWSTLHFILFVVPLTISILSFFAVMSTTRYYDAFLRRVVLIAKIENMLGIDSQVKVKGKEKPKHLVWEKDKRFMIKSYWESRKIFKDSEEFIRKRRWKGDNQWAVITFVSFFVIGIFLLILHTILWI